MTYLPKLAGLPSKFTQFAVGIPASIVGAAILLFLIEAGVPSLA